VPIGAERDTVSVKSDVPEPVIDVGLKLPVTPEGIPAADNATAESNPPDPVTVTTA
jgi:transaldolase